MDKKQLTNKALILADRLEAGENYKPIEYHVAAHESDSEAEMVDDEDWWEPKQNTARSGKRAGLIAADRDTAVLPPRVKHQGPAKPYRGKDPGQLNPREVRQVARVARTFKDHHPQLGKYFPSNSKLMVWYAMVFSGRRRSSFAWSRLVHGRGRRDAEEPATDEEVYNALERWFNISQEGKYTYHQWGSIAGHIDDQYQAVVARFRATLKIRNKCDEEILYLRGELPGVVLRDYAEAIADSRPPTVLVSRKTNTPKVI